jgi:hypothetical protein
MKSVIHSGLLGMFMMTGPIGAEYRQAAWHIAQWLGDEGGSVGGQGLNGDCHKPSKRKFDDRLGCPIHSIIPGLISIYFK